MKGNQEPDNTKDLTYNVTGWGGSCIRDAAEL